MNSKELLRRTRLALIANSWHESTTEKLNFDTYEGYWSWKHELWMNFALTGDYEVFLNGLNKLQIFWENYGPDRSRRAYVLLDQDHSRRLSVAKNWHSVSYGEDAMTFGDNTWIHELAHREAAKIWGMEGMIRVTLTKDVGGYRAQPYMQMRMGDCRRLARENRLLWVMANVLMAPELVGVGYPEETDLARRLFEAAGKFE